MVLVDVWVAENDSRNVTGVDANVLRNESCPQRNVVVGCGDQEGHLPF